MEKEPHVIQIDCFAYKNQNCTILTELLCKHQRCPFFKTQEQLDRENVRAKQRNLL